MKLTAKEHERKSEKPNEEIRWRYLLNKYVFFIDKSGNLRMIDKNVKLRRNNYETN